jgi:streptogramin lyase
MSINFQEIVIFMMKRLRFIFLLLIVAGCSKVNDSETNLSPVIAIKISNTTPMIGSVQTLTAEVSDPNPEDSVTVSWEVTAGELSQTTGLEVNWTTPNDTTTVQIVAAASDGNGGRTLAEMSVYVGNSPPEITAFRAGKSHIIAGNSITLTCTATDAEGGDLVYQFYDLSNEGHFEHESPQSDSVKWISPIITNQAAVYRLAASVADELGFTSCDTLEILVYTNYGSVWVVDSDHKTLSKYTANGIKVFTAAYQFNNPVSVITNIDESYGCFVADQGANQVLRFNADGENIAVFSNLPYVSDIAIHHASRKVWAISYGANSATVIDGVMGEVEKTITGFINPTSIEINQRTGDVWILEEGHNRVIQLNVSSGIGSLPDSLSGENVHIFRNGFNAPHRLCFHNIKTESLLSQVYIADMYDDQVERISADGEDFQQLSPVNLLSPQPVLLGVVTLNLKDLVLTVNSFGRIEVFEAENTPRKSSLSGNYNFIKPVTMHIDERTNECWIGDTGTNQLVKIKINSDYSFSVLRKISGFLAIKDLAVNR